MNIPKAMNIRRRCVLKLVPRILVAAGERADFDALMKAVPFLVATTTTTMH